MGCCFFFFLLLLFSLTLFSPSFSTLQPSKPEKTQELESARILDPIITNYTFQSHETTNFKTGELHTINLPSNLSGINVDAIRLRCGSLQRYGAKIKEFDLGRGVNVHPCTQRVILVRLNLGPKWSSLYYNNYELSATHQLISPILGLSAYGYVKGENSSNFPSELEIRAGKKGPIAIDFSSTPLLINAKAGLTPLCASFDHKRGKFNLSNQTRPNACAATGQGRFGLVVESSPLIGPLKGKVSKWKIAIVSSIGGVLGACLLSLLLIAMFVNAKKKARMDEMERRAYEEEALQVSMVGHVRAVTANGTRTVPTIEHYEYRNNSRS
ncbi:hypothetical protein PHJA_000792800 [Phtheirospermum japonicum]|uniref:Uncharacterized protein n=1 Tax=Phtheirospermum japonicum TaxID=374723 RepID=A0A830BFW2_9LAMI|nr:hypothetical protein PHJA_000792800 [Phtheirospermum japonicum]